MKNPNLSPSFTRRLRIQVAFTSAEWRRLAGFYGFIAALHLVGWGLYLHYAAAHPALIGLGLTAYLLGLRHAFDADHIAAVDDTVRLLIRGGQRPLGVGFFFSLGHATVVLMLAIVIAISAASVKAVLPELRNFGSLIGASVSGVFLCVIGLLNFLVLLDIFKVWQQARAGAHSHTHLEAMLARKGLISRIFGGKLLRLINHSWKMYPLGILFGLGFDTASEVGLLTMTAGASLGDLSLGAITSLPLLFAAGMSIMDTTDGVLMAKAYDWALINPLRKIFYNAATTSLSVVMALVIGTVELAQVVVRLLNLQGGLYDVIARLDFGMLGYGIVLVFLIGWLSCVIFFKCARRGRVHSVGKNHGALVDNQSYASWHASLLKLHPPA